jgi:hypothetical protein
MEITTGSGSYKRYGTDSITVEYSFLKYFKKGTIKFNEYLTLKTGLVIFHLLSKFKNQIEQ